MVVIVVVVLADDVAQLVDPIVSIVHEKRQCRVDAQSS